MCIKYFLTFLDYLEEMRYLKLYGFRDKMISLKSILEKNGYFIETYLIDNSLIVYKGIHYCKVDQNTIKVYPVEEVAKLIMSQIERNKLNYED